MLEKRAVAGRLVAQWLTLSLLIPEVQVIEKIVEVPVVLQRAVPIVQTVQKSVEALASRV